MKNQILLIPLVFLLCFAFACQEQGKEAAMESGVNVEADVAAIKASFDEWVHLYNACDFERIMSFYAENSIQMPPNEPIHKGKEAILLAYQKARELNDEHIDSRVIEDVRVSGDLAVAWGVDTGTTTPKSGGEPVKYNLKWLVVLERQSDGVWKWTYEMWNDNPMQSESVEQELIQLEKGWNEALIKHDWAFIDWILADDYTTTDSEGIIVNKAQEMVILETGEEAVTSVVADDFKVRIYGDTAVVTYRWTYKGQYRGKESAGQERYTDTWIRRDGRWQCVAAHASRIAQK